MRDNADLASASREVAENIDGSVKPFLEGSADTKQIWALLGRADPSTTMKFYAGISKEQRHKTTESIEKMLK